MTSNEITDLKRDFDSALTSAANAVRTLEFYTRVLKQAVLTHGGELRVDPSLSGEADRDTRTLEFGAGGVRLIDNMKGTKANE